MKMKGNKVEHKHITAHSLQRSLLQDIIEVNRLVEFKKELSVDMVKENIYIRQDYRTLF